MMSDKYVFNLPIGDWSGDGHEDCIYYKCESNQPVEQVRETHFKIKERTGIDIHGICNAYQENIITCDVFKRLNDIGFTDGCVMDDGEETFDPETMVKLWVFLLQKTDLALSIQIINDDAIPMLPFYGFDEKGRNIGFVGYGVF